MTARDNRQTGTLTFECDICSTTFPVKGHTKGATQVVFEAGWRAQNGRSVRPHLRHLSASDRRSHLEESMSPRMDKPHGCPDPDWCGEGCAWDCQADPDALTNDHPRPPPWRYPTPEQWATQRAKEPTADA